MNKSDKISFYRKQIKTAEELKQISMQNYNIATQLESEAKSALDMLGANSGRTRKGNELSEQTQNTLRASLTK